MLSYYPHSSVNNAGVPETPQQHQADVFNSMLSEDPPYASYSLGTQAPTPHHQSSFELSGNHQTTQSDPSVRGTGGMLGINNPFTWDTNQSTANIFPNTSFVSVMADDQLQHLTPGKLAQFSISIARSSGRQRCLSSTTSFSQLKSFRATFNVFHYSPNDNCFT